MRKFNRFCVILFCITSVLFLVGCGNVEDDENYAPTPMELLHAHAEENGYIHFINYMENMAESERAKILELLDGNHINSQVQTFTYQGISATKDYCYIGGRYTIPYGVSKSVVWSENIQVDKNNENTNFNRHYVVADSSKDAYMIIYGENAGYGFVGILSNAMAETNEVMTEEGLQLLITTLNNRKNILLCSLAETSEITVEEIGQLYENEENYCKLYTYIQSLPQEPYEAIHSLFENGTVDDGIDTVALQDGVYIFTDVPNVKWKDNVDTFENVNEESASLICTIIDTTKPAYILISTQNGYRLMVFNVSES